MRNKVYQKFVIHHFHRETGGKVCCALKWGERLGHPIQYWGEVLSLSPQPQLAGLSRLRAVGTEGSPDGLLLGHTALRGGTLTA